MAKSVNPTVVSVTSTDAAGSANTASLDRGRVRGVPPTLEWVGDAAGHLAILDQTLLPTQVETLPCARVEQVWEAIRALRVRGAPAIGVAAAYGLYLGVREDTDLPADRFLGRVAEVAAFLKSSRPTAVNLAWAVQRVQRTAEAAVAEGTAGIALAMLAEAEGMAAEDAAVCRQIGESGADLIPAGGGVLTHCNAGALATVAYGTALALMYVAQERGRRFRVYADETRPLLQGARLTAFELAAAGIDVTLICDSAAASLMGAGKIDVVVVGADRIAANGDTANKIGTYSVAVAAKHHGIPFYVAAPLSTFDLAIPNGGAIPIEQRSEDEIRNWAGRTIAPPAARCYNPAFDVTPVELITGIVTERGLVKPVTEPDIRRVFAQGGSSRPAGA